MDGKDSQDAALKKRKTSSGTAQTTKCEEKYSNSALNDVLSLKTKEKWLTEELAAALDAADPLAKFRNEFSHPHAAPYTADAPQALYLCGNSLGLQPKRCAVIVEEEMKKWRLAAVEGHFSGSRPWARVDEFVVPQMAAVVGAKASEVAVMNSLSVNLHLLLVSFYRPTDKRHKIIMEEQAFCSDHHVIKSQLNYHKRSGDSLIQLRPRTGETYLRTEDILAAIKKAGDELALVMLPGVQFYTGQLFDMKTITKAGHDVGAYVGFDLAHAVGNVEMHLHDWGVDFAAWCTYKYLNAGPGSIGGAFVHSKHDASTNEQLPRFCGWWGQTPENRFAMGSEWQMLPGAQSYQMSNPAVLPTVCLLASLDIFKDATMPAVRAKSLRLTGYLEFLLQQLVLPTHKFSVITPSDPTQRGCQLSLMLGVLVRPVQKALSRRGVIVDVREPNVMRVSPAPLYNSYADVYRFVRLLLESLDECRELTAKDVAAVKNS